MMDDDDFRILIGAVAGEKAPPELLELAREAAAFGPGSARTMLESFWVNLWQSAREAGGLSVLIASTQTLRRLRQS